MATPEELELLNRYKGSKPKPVAIDPLQPIFGGETPEAAAARRAKEEREARSGQIAEESFRLQQQQAGRAATQDIREQNKAVQDLQTRYRGYDSYKKYTAAVGLYNAGLNTQPNTAGDLELITYAAKMRDPTTGVLGGEAEQTKKIETYINQIKAQVAKQFGWEEGGTLTPEGRNYLRTNLKNAFENNYRPLYLQDREYFTQEAKASGFDPVRIVGPDPLDAYKSSIEGYWAKQAETPPATGGGQEGPTVSVTPEASIQAFGFATGGKPGYDAQGNIVGLDYAVAGNTVYDESGKPLDLPLMGRVSEEVVQKSAPSFYEGLVQSVTGEDKATTATETLPDWVEMPELQKLFSMPSMKVGLSTALGGGPQEIAQIVQSNFPDTKVFQDEKGNYILQSPSTGQRYAIKPGFQLSDVPRALSILLSGGIGGGGAGATALRTAGREALGQTFIEGVQSAAGGTFNPADIIAAGAMGGGGQKLVEALPGAVQAVRGMRAGNVPTRVAATTDEFAMPAPGGIPMPGGRVTPAPVVPTTVATEEVATAGPRTFEAGETVTSRAGGAMGTSPENVRLMQAEGLPVPVEMTRGAATRDPEQLAFEKEQLYGALGGPLRRRAEENNLQVLQNFDRFIDMTGAEAPDIAATGNAVINTLSKGYQAAKNRVNAAYKRAEKAGETQELVSYKDISDFINEQTPTTRTTLHPILQSTLEKLKIEDPTGTGMISIKSMEDIRKSINKSAWDDPYGASLKEKIDLATEGKGGDLYKEARRLRIEQANKFENRAIVARLVSNIKNMADRKVPADKVFNSVILNESPENIQFLKQTLRDLGDDGKQAWSELQGATLRHIQEEATKNVNLTSENLPIASVAKLNQVVNALDKNGRLDLIFNPKMAQQIRDLRDVMQYVNTVPPGTSINNSGTARTLMALLSESGLTAWATGGIPVPLITGIKVIRDQVKDTKIKKQITRSLLPRGERD